MENLAQQRCFHHVRREAVARCPECLRFFCRECITEHNDRVICAACLRKISGDKGVVRHPWRVLGISAAFCAGIFFAWIAFYAMGKALIAIPTSFHDGTLWRALSSD